MFNSKIYATLAVALPFAVAAPAQAGWNAWQYPIAETARQQPTIAPAPGYEAFASVRDRGRYRRLPSAGIATPSKRPVVGHTGHIGGY